MTSMVERVARAIFASMHDEFNQWGELDSEEKDAFMGDARAAIEAMREPTESLVTAGRRECILNREQAKRVYSAMIDAALKETDNAHDR